MAAKRKLLVQSGFVKKIAHKVWNNITPDNYSPSTNPCRKECRLSLMPREVTQNIKSHYDA